MRFVDAHTHLELFAFRDVPLEKARSVEDVRNMILSLPKEVVLGWGWREESLGTSLEREHLEDIPKAVLLLRMDAHVGVVNGRLIDTIGLEKSDKFDPERGYLYEEELWRVASLLKPKGNDMAKAIMKGLREAASMGVVEIHDFVDGDLAEVYAGLEDIPVSVVLMPYYEDHERVVDVVRRSKRFRLGWVKIFVDGSIGARTAYLKEPYEDTSSRGLLLKNYREIASAVEELESKGLRVALHAIGDGAVEECLRAFEVVRPKLPYHRIEHAELITRDQALRAKELRLLLCMQPNFTPFFRETYLKALGRERGSRINPIGMLDELGVDMIFGSDMMPFDPMYGFNYAKSILGERKAKYYYGGWRDEGRYL